MTSLAIETHGLVKAFGDTRAVDGLDLTVPTGGVYGVLGPNGAGKTTAIRMLATLLRPDGGKRPVLGHDVVAEADAVRCQGQPHRPVRLARRGPDRHREPRAARAAARVQLRPARASAGRRAARRLRPRPRPADRQVKNYSGGMRRRIDIAASIVVTPELLFLDEPTTGLDPRSRNQVWDIVRALVAGGHHRAAHDAVPRRGRPARRPHRRDRPRQGHRRGHERRAQGIGRQRARCTSASPIRDQRCDGVPRLLERRSASTVTLDGRPGGDVGTRVDDPERVAARRSPQLRDRRHRRRPSSPWASPAWTRCSSP